MRVQKAMRVIDAHIHTHRLAELAQVTHLILSQLNLRVIKENFLSTFLTTKNKRDDNSNNRICALR